jgi:hypothetical protein
MSDRVIHIIEPTLVSDAGHCSIVVQSLCAAGEGLRFCVWVGRQAKLSWPQNPNVEIRPYFYRRLRRLQAAWLYWRLLRSGARLLITTAGRTDLVLLNLVGPRPIPPGRVFLYVHQLRLNPQKEAVLRQVASQQPHLMMMTTTDALEKSLRDYGFHHTMVILPISSSPIDGVMSRANQEFQHVLVAGAARSDKGFSTAVDFIGYLAVERVALPISIQISGDHYGRHDTATRAAIERLKTIQYPSLEVVPETLTRHDYVKLFCGAICLQPYDREEYANKLSAITLDAFTAGAPVVTVAHTWMAKMVNRFEAGAVVEEPTCEALLKAIQMVRNEYVRYASNARRAGSVLAGQDKWAALISMLKSETIGSE